MLGTRNVSNFSFSNYGWQPIIIVLFIVTYNLSVIILGALYILFVLSCQSFRTGQSVYTYFQSLKSFYWVTWPPAGNLTTQHIAMWYKFLPSAVLHWHLLFSEDEKSVSFISLENNYLGAHYPRWDCWVKLCEFFPSTGNYQIPFPKRLLNFLSWCSSFISGHNNTYFIRLPWGLDNNTVCKVLAVFVK
jgi:hypothetical protein